MKSYRVRYCSKERLGGELFDAGIMSGNETSREDGKGFILWFERRSQQEKALAHLKFVCGVEATTDTVELGEP